jgi:streptogramin lyase
VINREAALMKALCCSGVLAAFVMTGCGSQSSGVVPGGAGYASFRDNAVAAKRGAVRVFDDTYGDPVPEAITTGPDGALWYTDGGLDAIGRITTAGEYTLLKEAGAIPSVGIVTGPDKNLWFTLQQQYGGIGRITTAGVVTLFTDPGGEYTQGITVGPDGALWFTESNGTVGRVTTKGAVTHFTVAATDAELEGIVTGPDGNLWVTQYIVGGSRLSDQVLRVTPKGKYTSFTVDSGPKFICVGPDKALWFSEIGSNALGRITTSGKYAAFPTGGKYVEPSGIAAGPDGALWFTDFSGSEGIGRMTTKGDVHFYGAGGGELVEITPGPRGYMWFTSAMEPAAIGRIATR